MSGDRTGETTVTATLSEATAAWLEERAADLGVSRQELLRGLLAAYRVADEDGVAPATRADLAELREAVADLDAETDDKIDDMRERVVQVKREADAKAPADHDHSDLRERVEGAEAEAEALAREVATLRETAGDLRADLGDLEAAVAGIESTVEDGFANYEEVLEYLTDERDRLDADVDAVTEAVANVREEVRALAARVTTTAGVERLREAANRHGVRTAACEDCGGEVDVALLTRPACPHCAATFADLEPRRGFLGNHTLVVGEVPALEAGDLAEFGAEPVRATDGAPDGAEPAVDDDDPTDSGHDHLDPFENDD